MALLTCPDCGNKVSSKAAKCPHCGCPVSVMIQEKQKNEKKQEPEQQVDESVQNMATERSSFEGTQIVEPEQPKIEQKQNVGNAEIINDNVKWLQGALISGVLIAVIVIIIYFYKQPSKDNDYTNAQYEPHNTETITSTTTPAKIHNPAEAKLRLNDFQKKITSAPFENGAVEIVKVIDNDYAKCMFFLSNIVEHYTFDAIKSESHNIGSLFAYNAVSNTLYEFKDKAFNKVDVAKLQHHKTIEKNDVTSDTYDDMYPGLEVSAMGYIQSYYEKQGYDLTMFRKTSKGYYSCFENVNLNIADYSNKGCVIINYRNNYHRIICRVTVDKFNITNEGGYGEIYDDKFIVIGGYENYDVVDLSSGEKIDNPFWKSGPISLYGADGVKFVGNVSPQGGVKGKLTYQGHTFDVTNGSVDDKDVLRLLVSRFLIQKQNNRFFLYEMADSYYHGFFVHSLDKAKPSDFKQTIELFKE